MRGASALQKTLAGARRPVAAFVVWEPVLHSDQTAPATSVLARVSDPRARQYWDDDRLLSKHMIAVARADSNRAAYGWTVEEPMIVWDYVAVFPPGARWDSNLPPPEYAGSTVLDHIEAVSRRL